MSEVNNNSGIRTGEQYRTSGTCTNRKTASAATENAAVSIVSGNSEESCSTASNSSEKHDSPLVKLNKLMAEYKITKDFLKKYFGFDYPDDYSYSAKTKISDVEKVIKEIKRCLNDDGTWDENLLVERRIETICDKYDIDFQKLPPCFYNNFLKAVDYVEKYINEGKLQLTGSDKENSKFISRKIKDFTIALNYNWDSFDELLNDSKDCKNTIVETLVSAGFLEGKKDMHLRKYSYEELEEALKAYYESFNCIKPEDYGQKSITDPKKLRIWQMKMFRQSIGRLLINSTEKEKKLIFPIFIALQNEYQDEAFSMIALIDDPESLHQVSDEILINKPSCIENLNTNNQLTVYSNAGVDSLSKYTNNQLKICEISEDEYKIILEKKQNGTINKKEQEVLNSVSNVAAVQAALPSNRFIKKSDRILIAADIDTKLRRNKTAYYDMIAEQHKIVSINIPEENRKNVTDFLNLISNYNFSKIVENPNSELNKPVDVEQLLKEAKEELGYKQLPADAVAESRRNVTVIQDAISKQTVQEPQITVESANSSKENIADKNTGSGNSAGSDLPSMYSKEWLKKYTLSNATYQVAYACLKEGIYKFDDLLKDFTNLTQSTGKYVVSVLKRKSDEDDVINDLNTINSHTEAAHLAQELDLSDEAKKKLKLDTNANKILEDNVA